MNDLFDRGSLRRHPEARVISVPRPRPGRANTELFHRLPHASRRRD